MLKGIFLNEKFNPLINAEDSVDHESIAAAIFDKNGRLLVMDHVKFAMWTIPCGKVHPDQSIIDGLKMELGEEVCILPTKFHEVGSFAKVYDMNGKNVRVNTHIFEIMSYRGRIKNGEPAKCRELRWIPFNKESLRKLSKNQKLSDSLLEYLKIKGMIL
jgi:8-oxo-dGTP pyrophosphatase MutT (NUDIX family)